MSRSFFLLMWGQFISKIGTQVALTATMFVFKEATGSATWVALIMAACALPAVVIGPFGGTFADRYSRMAIIVFCDLWSGALLLVLAASYAWLHLSISRLILVVFLVNLLVAMANAFFTPAVNAVIPDILNEKRVAQGMSWSQISVSVSMLIGQALAGILFAWGGAAFVFFLDGITYVFTAGVESSIRIPARKRQEAASWRETAERFWLETKEGLSYVQSRPGMKSLFFAAVPLNISFVPIFVLLPFFTTDLLHKGAEWYGYLLAAFTLGSIAGYGAGAFGPVRRPGIQLSGCVILNGLLCTLLPWVNHAWTALALIFTLGLLVGVINLTAIAAVQVRTAAAMRGRVFGLLTMITQGLTPIAMCVAGVMADMTHGNIRLVYTVCGIINMTVAIAISFNKELHAFLEGAKSETVLPDAS